MKYKLIALIKGFLLFSRIPLLFGFLQHPFQFSAHLMGLSKWIRKHGPSAGYNDFYTVKKNYKNRENLFNYVIEKENLKEAPINYLEFGVSQGHSFLWWLSANQNNDSKFWGFDTFEGLPEKWLFFKRGDMQSDAPQSEDTRGEFIKGLFQDTLYPFIDKHGDVLKSPVKKVIHMDADLFSSTLFSLTTLAPYINEGDIILFDEFNVPNHEFAAWEIFCRSYYVDFELLGAVNNYYQVALKFKGMAVFK